MEEDSENPTVPPSGRPDHERIVISFEENGTDDDGPGPEPEAIDDSDDTDALEDEVSSSENASPASFLDNLRNQILVLGAAALASLLIVSLLTVYAVASWTNVLPEPRVGVTGATGLAGDPGPKGKKGRTGPRGTIGTMGPVGAQGSQGPDGIFCVQGSPSGVFQSC